MAYILIKRKIVLQTECIRTTNHRFTQFIFIQSLKIQIKIIKEYQIDTTIIDYYSIYFNTIQNFMFLLTFRSNTFQFTFQFTFCFPKLNCRKWLTFEKIQNFKSRNDSKKMIKYEKNNRLYWEFVYILELLKLKSFIESITCAPSNGIAVKTSMKHTKYLVNILKRMTTICL